MYVIKIDVIIRKLIPINDKLTPYLGVGRGNIACHKVRSASRTWYSSFYKVGNEEISFLQTKKGVDLTRHNLTIHPIYQLSVSRMLC